MGSGSITIVERQGKRGVSLQAVFYATPPGERRPRRIRLVVPRHITAKSAAERWAVNERKAIETEGLGPTTREGRERARREAEAAAEKERAERAERVTIAEVWAQWLTECEAARQSPRTIEGKRISGRHIMPVLGERAAKELGELDVTRLKKSLAHLSASTMRLVLQHLDTALGWARNALNVAAPKLKAVKGVRVAKGEPRVYDPASLERLVKVSAGLSAEHLAVVLLGGEAALRRGEIAGVRVEDLDVKHRLLFVRRQVINVDGQRVERPPKGGRPRCVPLTPRLLEALVGLAREVPADGWLLRTQRQERGPATEGAIDVRVREAMKAAGLKVEGSHILRHSALSHMLVAGVDVEVVREIAGHVSLAVTARYLHRTTPLQSAAEKLAAMRAGFEGASLPGVSALRGRGNAVT
jgi:integrase